MNQRAEQQAEAAEEKARSSAYETVLNNALEGVEGFSARQARIKLCYAEHYGARYRQSLSESSLAEQSH